MFLNVTYMEDCCSCNCCNGCNCFSVPVPSWNVSRFYFTVTVTTWNCIRKTVTTYVTSWHWIWKTVTVTVPSCTCNWETDTTYFLGQLVQLTTASIDVVYIYTHAARGPCCTKFTSKDIQNLYSSNWDWNLVKNLYFRLTLGLRLLGEEIDLWKYSICYTVVV